MSKIIPAIDIIEGKCVRLTKGDYNTSKVYNEDPVHQAKIFEEMGACRLHIVDLDAAKSGNSGNKTIIKRIIKETQLDVQIGGGIRTRDQCNTLIELGASRLIIGSKAQTDKQEVALWLEEFGPEALVFGADVRNGKIAIHGWLDTSQEDIADFLFYYTSHGGKHFLCTDILKDGTLNGPATEMYINLMHKFPDVNLIASGGVSCEQDLNELVNIGMEEIVVGKAIYESRLDLKKIFKAFV